MNSETEPNLLSGVNLNVETQNENSDSNLTGSLISNNSDTLNNMSTYPISSQNEALHEGSQENEPVSEVLDDENGSQDIATSDYNNEESNSAPEVCVITNDDDNEERPAKKGKFNQSRDEDEGNMCSICFDVWTSHGDHRVCSLVCGHLFGHSCLVRWMKNANGRCCPTCKKRVYSHKDIRFLYAKKIVAIDTSDLEETRKNLEFMTKEKDRLFAKVQAYSSREIALQKTISNLKRELIEIKETTSNSHVKVEPQSTSKPDLKIRFRKCLDMNITGGCRVFDFNRNTDVLAVSVKSNNLFIGYGVKLVNMNGYLGLGYVHLHSKPIRDISHHYNFDWLLSVSFDKKVKLLDVHNQRMISSFPRSCELWSCCWDSTDSNYFFVGEARGTVSKFDIRNTPAPVCVLENSDDYSPVVSLASAQLCPGNFNSPGALVCCQLNSCTVRDQSLCKDVKYTVPMDGPFVCASYCNASQHLLVSARPNKAHIKSRHSVFSWVRDGDDSLVMNNVHTFAGATTQKFMSRSCQLMYKENMYVTAYQETYKNVAVWNVKTGKLVKDLPASLPVLDICPIQLQNDTMLATLSEWKMNIFTVQTE